MFSGKTGKVIKWVGVPDNKESYYSPQWYILPDGVEMVLFGTGGETHGGSLWRITLEDLINGDIDKVCNKTSMPRLGYYETMPIRIY